MSECGGRVGGSPFAVAEHSGFMAVGDFSVAGGALVES